MEGFDGSGFLFAASSQRELTVAVAGAVANLFSGGASENEVEASFLNVQADDLPVGVGVSFPDSTAAQS